MRSIQELINLKGRVALITGGAGHVGRAMSEALAEVGADLVLLDREGTNLEEISENLEKKFSNKCLPIFTDLSKESDILKAPKLVEEKFGKLNILINNAAYVGTSNLKGWSVPFEEQSRDTWRDTLEVNLTAPFIMIQAFTKILRESKNSSVINIGSIRGMLGVDMKLYEGTKMGSSIAYSASKGGLLQMTRYLATVLAPDIRVNSISLGGIARNQNELFTKRYIDSTPLGRMGKEEDTKGAAVYLASDLSEYVTGHNLVLDGGWVSW